MKSVNLPCGTKVPSLGIGTWKYGEDRGRRTDEIATLRLTLDLCQEMGSVALIDTAEMYGEGAAEEVIGEAIAGRRDQVYLVSKVYPHNATRRGTAEASQRSLRRLRTDVLDLYLLHWRGEVPLAESIAALEALRQSGQIRAWGVSNLDLADMRELWDLPAGHNVQTNQLLYNLARRGIEFDLLPWLRERSIPVMAYSPIEQARLVQNPRLVEFADRYGMTPAQAALAWLLQNDDMIAIPKTSNLDRLRENFAALEISLNAEQLAELDRLFPPPTRPKSLEML